jgi:hypothetical protein
MTRTSREILASFLRRVCGSLLTFLFPEPPTKYRREDHYMRGPGPKWHAKHSPTAHPSPEND